MSVLNTDTDGDEERLPESKEELLKRIQVVWADLIQISYT